MGVLLFVAWPHTINDITLGPQNPRYKRRAKQKTYIIKRSIGHLRPCKPCIYLDYGLSASIDERFVSSYSNFATFTHLNPIATVTP